MATTTDGASRLPRAVRPLRHPAYRWLAGNLAASVLAEGLWVVAVVWQVIALGGGATAFSLVSGALALGAVLTALLGGVLADRLPQRRILLVVAAMQVGAVGLVAGLSLTGTLGLPALVVVAAVIGVAGGLMFPAYSAVVPRLVPADELQAVNGLEGMLRPVLLSAVGPAIAGFVVAVAGPGVALGAVALASAVALGCASMLPATPVLERGDGAAPTALADLREGFRYMLVTRWLLVTLVFACLMILAVLGPLEVLVPFAVKDRAGGGPGEHALVLACYGAGGVVGSFAAGSLRTPRRYLTAMIVMWSVASLPLAVFGLATSLWPMAVAGFLIGALFSAPQVIWGTLLQRRVPPELLGRVSSLDFFVSLAFMPVSMALAGPISGAVGLEPVFVVAALAPPVIGAVALLVGRLGPDELDHPLDVPTGPAATGATGPGGPAEGISSSSGS
ncbi:MFS transporter [Actinomycetospora termitidis]|uniref:MFS transporter n=1 Tax=Actinomycetospora termitidis TaxID=3053470 RepID=A0ABT7MB25_9PSEU|nr:MFS transporter [Actinomycetospora sp. Odt1-22]MDL5157867.1 MFS transporter [Actinomycetospora sp. Odt1-22]